MSTRRCVNVSTRRHIDASTPCNSRIMAYSGRTTVFRHRHEPPFPCPYSCIATLLLFLLFRPRLPGSTRRCVDALTRRCVDASMHRRKNESTRRRIDVSTRRRDDASTRSRVDASTRQRVDAATRRRADASTCRRNDASTRRRVASTCPG